ncbi:maltotransferase domain-containing protein, partial [Rhodovulum sp. PH10]|uniref:maltotransferase domain-containing protein n=1 Tax=Rhodovulum sp. PH10 TaxID=1187851 RepID=UPI0005914E73
MNFPRAPRSPLTYEPHLSLTPDTPPLDSDEYARRFVIEDVFPTIDGGRHAVKRVVGEPIDVWADIFRDGHEVTAAALRWRREGERGWRTASLVPTDNDRWHGGFTPSEIGRHVFVIEAWTSNFATWRRDTLAKQKAGVAIALDLKEGRELIAAAVARAGDAAGRLQAALNMFEATGEAGT